MSLCRRRALIPCLDVNSQVKRLKKSIKNVPKSQLSANTEWQRQLEGLNQALRILQHDVLAKIEEIGKELQVLQDKTQLVTEAAMANGKNITSICEIGDKQIDVCFK